MKQWMAYSLTLSLSVLVGCNQGDPGGPGASSSTTDTLLYGQAEDSFNLSVPLLATTVRQGETVEGTIGIKRGTNFGETVVLSFANLPPGVTLEPASPDIRPDATETRVTIRAADNSPVGGYTIRIKGQPEKGQDAHVAFKLTIQERPGFLLSVPRLTTTLAPGKTATVAIAVMRGTGFDHQIRLSLGDLPRGVSASPTSAIVSKLDPSAPFVLAAAPDAVPGDFTVRVTAHPEQGADKEAEIRITVTGK